MSWWKIITSESIEQKIKSSIRTSPFFKKMFDHFGVDFKDLWELKIRIAHLDGEYAKNEGNDIILDRKLISKPIEEIMHYVAHELTHWLTRKREEHHYFSDPEEVDAFEWAIAHELQRGSDMDEIVSIFLPLISNNCDPTEAEKRLIHMISKAKKLIS